MKSWGKNGYKVVVSIVLVVCFVACKKTEVEPVDMNYDYFPLQKGTYQIYDVEEINYLSNGQVNTSIYQLKTVIGDTFIGNGGQLNYEFKRFKRANELEEWTYSDLWTTARFNNNLELVEENERKVKLVFPFGKNKSWNENAYNTLDPIVCKYEDLFVEKQFNGLAVGKTVTVRQEDEFNLIMYRKKYEIYQKGIGLVKKHYQHYDISNFDTTNIQMGKAVYYSIVSYGVE